MRGALLLLLFIPALALGESLPRLRIATWNLEWLVSAATAHAARLRCREGKRTLLPCDVAFDGARSSPDFARLAAYARELDADVVAFQEVEDADTAARIFGGYRFCLSGRRLTQNLGFAVRKGLAFQCGPDVASLAMTGAARPGVTMVLDPGGPRELHLLTVHLKSGCADAPLDSSRPACSLLASQVPRIGAWMNLESRAGHRHVVLGDFNRAWESEGAAAAITPTADATPQLYDPGDSSGFRSCYSGQGFTRYIDHLLVGRGAGLGIVPGSFFRVRFEPADVRRYRLSDHCPTGVVLQFTARNSRAAP